MRKRFVESSENDIILNSIYDLTHVYDDEGNEVPTYFNAQEISDNYGLSIEEVIDIAKSNGYNIHRIPKGDNLVNAVVIANDKLSYGDIIKDIQSEVDINELGEETDDSFNMEEDYMKEYDVEDLYRRLKSETDNFTSRDTLSFNTFEEQIEARKILLKHYDSVETFANNYGNHQVYFIDIDEPKKTKVKENKETQEYRGYKLVFHPGYNMWVNMRDYYKVYSPKGTLVGGTKTVDQAKAMIDKRIATKQDVNEDVNDSSEKKVTYKGDEFTVDKIEEEDDDVILTLSNGKPISVKNCVEKGTISTKDADIQAFMNRFKEEEPEESSEEEPDSDDAVDEIERYKEIARDDFQNKNDTFFKHIKKQIERGEFSTDYELAYYDEYNRLKNSSLSKAKRKVANSETTVAKTYDGDVDELIDWLRDAIASIDVVTGESGESETKNLIDELNKRDGTNYEAKPGDKQASSFTIRLKKDKMDDMPEDVYMWKALKNSGKFNAGSERELLPVLMDDTLTSNGIVRDLLVNYDFHLGKYNNTKNEDIDVKHDDVENAPYVVIADDEKFAFDTDYEAKSFMKRNEYSFDKLELIDNTLKEDTNDEVVEETSEYKIVKTIQHNFKTVKGVARKGKDKVIYQVYFRTQDYNPAVGRWMNKGWTNSTSDFDSIESARAYVKKYGKELKESLKEEVKEVPWYLQQGEDGEPEYLGFAKSQNDMLDKMVKDHRSDFIYENTYIDELDKETYEYIKDDLSDEDIARLDKFFGLEEDIEKHPTQEDIQWLKNWINPDKDSYLKMWDEDNCHAYIVMGKNAQNFFDEEDPISIFQWLKNHGFKYEITIGDYNYKTVGTFNSREMKRHNVGNDRTLKNRAKIDIYWNEDKNESLVEELEAGDCVYHPERDEYYYLKKTDKPNKFELYTYSDTRGFEIASPRFIDKNSPFYNKLKLQTKNANPEFKESIEEDVEKIPSFTELDAEQRARANERVLNNLIKDVIIRRPLCKMQLEWNGPRNYGVLFYYNGGDKQHKEGISFYTCKYILYGNNEDIEEDIEKQYYLCAIYGGYNCQELLADNIEVYAKNEEQAKKEAIKSYKQEYNYSKEDNPFGLEAKIVSSDEEDDLEEDIEKHDTLNPKLFDGEELKPEIKDKIEQIAYQFIRELNESDIKFVLKDIVLLGSNVSYNYTKDSDLDIHLIADSSGLNCPEDLYPLLYSAYRSMFNKNYDIKIKGIPAEIYVEMDEPQAKSNGIYSLNNGWIKKPEQRDIPDLDTEAFDKLFMEWEDKYFDLIESDATSEDIENFIEDIYDLRKESIANEGEYGLGNLVFKEFRNIGYLDNLKEIRRLDISNELSLEQLEEEVVNDNEAFWNIRGKISDVISNKYDEVNLIIDNGEIRPITKEEQANKFAVSVEHADRDDYKSKEEIEKIAKDIGAEKIMFFVYKGQYGGEYSFLVANEDIAKDIAKKYDQDSYASYDENGDYHEIKVKGVDNK